MNSNRWAGSCTAAQWVTSAGTAIWIKPSPSARWYFAATRYSYQAGGGIVADSSPQAEYDELMAKSAVLRRALELAAEGL